MQQGQSIGLRVYDNLMRDDANVEVILHAGDTKRNLQVDRRKGTKYAYNFSVEDKLTGVQVIEIFVNGVAISQSPIRVMITERDCAADFGGSSRLVADEDGDCVCQTNTYKIGGTCMDSVYFMLIIVAVVVVIFIGILFAFHFVLVRVIFGPTLTFLLRLERNVVDSNEICLIRQSS